MTHDEASKLLSDTVKTIVFSTVNDEGYDDLSDEEKTARLKSALEKKGFPFQDKKLMKDMIPQVKIFIRLFYENGRKSDENGKLIFGRCAELFCLSMELMA